MGGYGSGRHWGTTKVTVENCPSFDANLWARSGRLKPGWRGGQLTWSHRVLKRVPADFTSMWVMHRLQLPFSTSITGKNIQI